MKRAVCAVLCLLLAGGCFSDRSGRRSGPQTSPRGRRVLTTNDPLERTCALPKKLLLRLWRGRHPDHSEDITTVPLAPNFSGGFHVNSHSGPWDYLQTVPLVFYGPGQIRPRGRVAQPAAITDVYSTVGRIVGVDLPQRQGRTRTEILTPSKSPPRLVLVVVLDGVGRNVLERWPKAWPTLARLEREGASFVRAEAGSSPSITPAVHSSLGTGAYPLSHGITAIQYRDARGRVQSPFPARDPSALRMSTFADDIDAARENRPRVGMLAWKSWHLGMLGHGSQYAGGDRDELALITSGGSINGKPRYYSKPEFPTAASLLDARVGELDTQDGRADGRWMSHPIAENHANPAWVAYEMDLLISMLRRGGYGRDSVPDLFFANFKPADIVGHQYTMDSPEMREVLAAEDAALARILRYLDTRVRDYVVVVTADHGHTPSPKTTGAWPVFRGPMVAAVDEYLGTEDITDASSASGIFLDEDALRAGGRTEYDIAKVLNAHTIRDNWGDRPLPAGYEDRGDENVFSAAFPTDRLPDIMRCAFGRRFP